MRGVTRRGIIRVASLIKANLAKAKDAKPRVLASSDPCGNSSPSGFTRNGWWRAKDGTVTYFSVNGSDRTAARGINDSGTIVGFVRDPNDGKTKGFEVELDGSQCQAITVASGDLLEFPGAAGTFLQDIKNSGEIAGQYDDGSNNHGFIATPQ